MLGGSDLSSNWGYNSALRHASLVKNPEQTHERGSESLGLGEGSVYMTDIPSRLQSVLIAESAIDFQGHTRGASVASDMVQVYPNLTELDLSGMMAAV